MIKKAKYLHDYLLEVTFKDNTSRVIDLENFFKTSSLKLVTKFSTPRLFKQFRVEDGTLCWGDNECEINPYYIYEGRYDAQLAYA
jgi:hypothetical protein